MNYADSIEKYLKSVFKHIGIKPKMDISRNEELDLYEVFIEGSDLSFLIGYRGESLNALQTLLTLSLFKEFNEWVNVLVDINGYRDKRKEKIEEITKNYIDRVRFFKKDVTMPIMNASERRLVHIFVSGYDDINSESTGEAPYRRVVLKPL